MLPCWLLWDPQRGIQWWLRERYEVQWTNIRVYGERLLCTDIRRVSRAVAGSVCVCLFAQVILYGVTMGRRPPDARQGPLFDAAGSPVDRLGVGSHTQARSGWSCGCRYSSMMKKVGIRTGKRTNICRHKSVLKDVPVPCRSGYGSGQTVLRLEQRGLLWAPFRT